MYWHSKLRPSQIPDGLSKTFFVTEYHWSIDPENPSLGENYYGFGTPLAGGYLTTAFQSPAKDGIRPKDLEVSELGRMGSAHPTGFNVALCDGTVRFQAYDVDLVLNRRFANRDDGPYREGTTR